MPELREVITSQSVKDLYEAAEAGRLLVEERTKNEGQHTPGLRKGDSDVTEALLRYTHAKLMESAVPDHHPPNPEFPYRATITVSKIFPDKGGMVYGTLIGQITHLLGVNGLAWKPGAKPWRLWLRHWPPGFTPRLDNTRGKIDWQTEASIEREALVERPVIVTRDLRLIPLPEMEPTAVKTWVGLFVPAALALQDEAEILRQRVAELEEELEAKANGSAWGEVGQAIAEAMEEGG